VSREVKREIHLVEHEDGQWSATDEDADEEVRESRIEQLQRRASGGETDD